MRSLNRNHRAASSTAWLPDGGMHGGGDRVGGAAQDGESYRVRLRREDIPHAVVDVYTYVTSYDAGRDCYATVRAKWTLCTDPEDPEGTEQWSVSRAGHLSQLHDNWHDAIAVASQLAGNIADGTGRHALAGRIRQDIADLIFGWDGQPFEPDEAHAGMGAARPQDRQAAGKLRQEYNRCVATAGLAGSELMYTAGGPGEWRPAPGGAGPEPAPGVFSLMVYRQSPLTADQALWCILLARQGLPFGRTPRAAAMRRVADFILPAAPEAPGG